MEKHPLHLKTPELQTSPEVQRAVKREELHTGERVPNDPAERIEAYTDRLENIFLNPDERVRERNLEMFRDKIYDALIIKKENFPESYFELQQRIARERGQAVETILPDVREQMMDVAINDQRQSLDAWIDYLTSDDAVYPAWFKYYAWTQITKLSQFDKERGEFKKRTDSTVAPFPDIYREPLAQLCDLYEKVKADNATLKDPELQALFAKKFPSAYAELIQKSLEKSFEGREEIRGSWVKYEQGKHGDAEKLYASLEGKGTGWCTAGLFTAKSQIQRGDFYVYYTNDAGGEPTQPRLAIRMNGTDKIGEVRGILPHQNIEPPLAGTLAEKLQSFGSEADVYCKKAEDMRHVSLLTQKQEKGESFTRDDLVFLYEINDKIEGFGYQKDPRIAELWAQRNQNEDVSIIFDCTPEQIAHSPKEITNNTKIYIGSLFSSLFYTDIEHIYSSFPEEKIQKYHIEIGGKTKEQLEQELKDKKVHISSDAQELLKNPDFITSPITEGLFLIQISVASLGLASTKIDQIYRNAEWYGLDLCSAEVGPHLRLSYTGGDQMCVAMKQISNPSGDPEVFYLDRDATKLNLGTRIARPSPRYLDEVFIGKDQFVFSLRKNS